MKRKKESIDGVQISRMIRVIDMYYSTWRWDRVVTRLTNDDHIHMKVQVSLPQNTQEGLGQLGYFGWFRVVRVVSEKKKWFALGLFFIKLFLKSPRFSSVLWGQTTLTTLKLFLKYYEYLHLYLNEIFAPINSKRLWARRMPSSRVLLKILISYG